MWLASFMIRVPQQYLLPIVLLVTLTSIYVESPDMSSIIFTLGFGVLGYLMRRIEMSVLPFVIGFILAGNLESTARGAYSATGNDPWFLFTQPIAAVFMAISIFSIWYFSRQKSIT